MKKKFKVIFLIALCWYTYNSYVEFKNKKFFNIREVEVNTENKELISDIIGDLGSLKGHNILNVEGEKIKKILLEDIRVKNVIITKQMPDIISFSIEEKKPFTYVEYKGNIYVADNNGIIYSYMQESKKYNMPLFRINEEADVKEFIKILNKIKYSESISQVYRVKNGIAITVDSGMKIITDSSVKNEKYDIVKKLYELEKNKNGEIEYIDLRFEDYIIKRTKGDQR